MMVRYLSLMLCLVGIGYGVSAPIEVSAQIRPPPVRPPIFRPPITRPPIKLIPPGQGLPPLRTPPPIKGSPPITSEVPARVVPDNDDDDDVVEYYSDLGFTSWATTALTGVLTIHFSPSSRVNGIAMRKHIEQLYLRVAKKMFVQSSQAAVSMQLQTETQRIQAFDWDTKERLRKKMAVLKQQEQELNRLNEQARQEAKQRSQNWNSNSDSGWKERGRIKFKTGPAFQQLQKINSFGWSGF